MQKCFKSFLFFLLGFLFSCTDVIDVDVPNKGERLVVEASINWEKGTSGKEQIIKLSWSKPYFSNTSEIKPVIGAEVMVVKEDDNSLILFEDQKTGVYKTTNFLPELDKTYILKIKYKGKEYQAREKMIAVNSIHKTSQTVRDLFGSKEIVVDFFYEDPEVLGNYYLGEFKYEVLSALEVRDDKFSNGNENKISYSNEDLKVNDVVELNLYGVSKSYYKYMQLLIGYIGGSGGAPFESTPSKLLGNCKNIEDPDEEVLGYFRLSEFVKETYLVK